MKAIRSLLFLVTALLAFQALPVRADCPPPADGWTASGGAGIAHSVLAAAWDAAGRLVAGGYQDRSDLGTRRDWLVRAYDDAGRIVWHREFGGAAGRDEEITAIAAHPDGGVYLAGSWNETEWRIVRMDEFGGVQWERSYVSPGAVTGQPDPPTAAAVTSDGGVVVAGYEPRPDLGTGSDWLIRKYTAGGALLWSRSWSSPGQGDDQATGVGVDAAGRIVVAGFEYRAGWGQGYNWMVRRYSDAGHLLSTTGWTTPGAATTDRAWSLAVRPDGGFTVAGEAGGLPLVVSWNAAGAMRWTRADPAGGVPGAARAVGLMPGGAVIVAGSRGASLATEDWFVRGYGASGAAAWESGWAGPGGGGDRPRAIAVAADGRLAIGGYAGLHLTTYQLTVPCPPPPGAGTGETWTGGTLSLGGNGCW